MSQNINIDIPLEIDQEEMERMFEVFLLCLPTQVPHTQESQTFVASGSTTKNTGGRKGDISWVWLFYNKVPQDGEPSQCPKNFLCTCKVCAQEGKPVIPYKWKKGTGTGTLARHLESKHGLDAKNYKSGGGKKNQPTMSVYASSAPGGGKPFFYNRQDMIDNMAKYVCMTEQPFTYGDSEELEEFVKLSLQPLYYKVSRQTLKRRRRVLDEKRSSLDSRTVKMCVCKKDWDQAQRRMQGIKDEEEDSTTDDLLSTTGGSSIAETTEEDDKD
ncbi:hypothetical protein KSS87_020434 [Heliosperma pusillum]|nr:hypothetical protein KSS87_020434 [Heliosperma pusillum]